MHIRHLALALGNLGYDWQKDQFETLEKRCLKFVNDNPEEAYVECAKLTDYVPDVTGGLDKYDYRYFDQNNTDQENLV